VTLEKQQNPFPADTSTGTSLGKLTTLPQIPLSAGRGITPFPFPTSSTPDKIHCVSHRSTNLREMDQLLQRSLCSESKFLTWATWSQTKY